MNPDSSYLGEICEIYYVDYNITFPKFLFGQLSSIALKLLLLPPFFLRPLVPVTLFL